MKLDGEVNGYVTPLFSLGMMIILSFLVSLELLRHSRVLSSRPLGVSAVCSEVSRYSFGNLSTALSHARQGAMRGGKEAKEGDFVRRGRAAGVGGDVGK